MLPPPVSLLLLLLLLLLLVSVMRRLPQLEGQVEGLSDRQRRRLGLARNILFTSHTSIVYGICESTHYISRREKRGLPENLSV